MAAGDEVNVRVRLRDRGKFSGDAKKVKSDIRSIGDEADRSGKKGEAMGVVWKGVAKIFGLIKPAALVTALASVVQVAGAATAGAVGLTSALGPLVGLLPALAGAGIAYAGSMGIVKLAMAGVMDAVGGLNEEMDPEKLAALTPEARTLANTLDNLKPRILSIQQTAQRGLMPGVNKGLREIVPTMYAVRDVAGWMGDALGDVAASWGQSFGSKIWQQDIRTIGWTNRQVILELGEAIQDLMAAARSLIAVSGPLTVWLARQARAGAQYLAVAVQTARANGRLAAGFGKTQRTSGTLGRLLWALAQGLGGIMKAAAPAGDALLRILTANTEAWAKWTNSIDGQNTLSQYFWAAQPVVLELGRLIRDVTKAFFELGGSGSALPMLTAVRTELLPAFVSLAAHLSQKFAPTLINLMSSLADFLRVLTENAGGLTVWAAAITGAVQAVVWMLTNIPGLNKLVSLVLMGAAAWKIYTIAAKIAGGVMVLYGKAVALWGGIVRSYMALLVVWRYGMLASARATVVATVATVRQRVALMAQAVATRVSAVATRVSTAAQFLFSRATLAASIAVARQRIAILAQAVAARASAAATAVASAATTVWTAVTNLLSVSTLRATAAVVANRVATIASGIAMRAVAIATGLWTAAQWLLNAAMYANPIGLVILAVVALAAGFMLMYNKVGWFRSAVQAVWGWLKAQWPLLKQILMVPLKLAAAYFRIWWAVVKTVFRGVVAAARLAGAGLRAIWGGIKAYFTLWLGAVRAIFAGVKAVWNGLKAAASAVVGYVRGRFNAMVETFRTLKSRIGGAFSGVFDGLKEAFRSAINFIIRGWNGLDFKLPSVKIPGTNKKVGGVELGTPDLPLLASGGNVTGPVGSSWITGEAGPELNQLTGNGVRVTPLSGGAFSGDSVSELSDERRIIVEDHSRISLELDGEKVVKSVAKRAQDAKARR